MWDKEKKRDSSKLWTKNRDCPSKRGTVGKYVFKYVPVRGPIDFSVKWEEFIPAKPRVTHGTILV